MTTALPGAEGNGIVLPPRTRIGTDLVDVTDVATSVAQFGDRYLDRVFTPIERLQTRDAPHRIAARFAGKEAVLKLLRPEPTDAIPLRSIEIASLPSGAPRVRLSGAARARAGTESLTRFSISLTHDGRYAFATALAAELRKAHGTMNHTIRQVLTRYGNLTRSIDTIADEDDLFQAGLTSHATVNVMLAIEDELDCEFPDELLNRATFTSVRSLEDAAGSLVVTA